MGRRCRYCGRERANERFSGSGHKLRICRDCRKIPQAERFRIDACREIEGFLFRQSRISKKNYKRLEALAACDDAKVAKMAAAVLAVGKVHPYKRRRLGRIKHKHPELWQGLLDVGLVIEMPAFDELDEPEWLEDLGDEAQALDERHLHEPDDWLWDEDEPEPDREEVPDAAENAIRPFDLDDIPF